MARQASVLGEHEVTDARVFLLENPAVDAASIEIVSARERSYSSSADYEIQTIGAFTQVQFPSEAAQGRGTVLASYLYEVGVEAESTLTGDFGVSAGAGLRVIHALPRAASEPVRTCRGRETRIRHDQSAVCARWVAPDSSRRRRTSHPLRHVQLYRSKRPGIRGAFVQP